MVAKKEELKPILMQNEDDYYKFIYIVTQSFCKRTGVEFYNKAVELMNERGENDIDPDDDEELQHLYFEQARSLLDQILLIQNDYYCLVRDDKMEPYRLPDGQESGIEEMRESFAKASSEANMQLAMQGVPVKEGDDGKISIDYEKYREEIEKGEKE